MMDAIRYHPLLLFALSLVVMWLAARAGAFIRGRRTLQGEGIREDTDVVQPATLTLLGLIIGFSFSMAIGRYDQRKNLEEEEANAIGTAYVRADLLHSHGVAISMDGRGCWRDNVFVERLWRSIKHEEVYLHACESVSASKASVGRYLEFYNGRRAHTALADRTPDEPYFTQETRKFAA